MRLAVLMFFVGGIGGNSTAWGQDVNNEYKLKAVYLYKFATYVKWPNEPQQQEVAPFIIGILGPDPVGTNLRKIAKVKKVYGRPIVVRNYQEATQVVDDCHILFISRDLPNNTQQEAITLLAKRSILIVGESSKFLEQGGVIDFIIQDNRIKVYISKSAYKNKDFEISAQLLRIATIVE